MSERTFNCRVVPIGNGEGMTLGGEDQDTVLGTSDLFTCTAVCGYIERLSLAFMIHSDSTGTSGQGQVSLIDGINNLLGKQVVGNGYGFVIALFGGSIPGTRGYLVAQLPNAGIAVGEQTETAYIAWNGFAAGTKAGLATKFEVDKINLPGCIFS